MECGFRRWQCGASFKFQGGEGQGCCLLASLDTVMGGLQSRLPKTPPNSDVWRPILFIPANRRNIGENPDVFRRKSGELGFQRVFSAWDVALAVKKFC